MVRILLLCLAFAFAADAQFLQHRRQAFRPAGSAPAGPTLLPGDEVSTNNLWALYSLNRRMTSNYLASAFRLRRTSDNSEQDIGFSGGSADIDIDGIESFVSGGLTAHIVTIYDQSGGGHHLTQATANSQPKFIDSGNILTGSTGKWIALFDGSDDYLKTAQDTGLTQPTIFYPILEQDTWTSTDRVFDGFSLNSSLVYQFDASAELTMFAGGGNHFGPDFGLDTTFLLTALFNAASSTIRKNNDSEVTGSPGTSTAQGFTLGASGSATLHGNIRFSEALIYEAAHSAGNQGSIRTNLISFYSIP